MSWEIEEIGDDSKSEVSNKGGEIISDVHVAVGKNDMHVLQWALDHAISPGIRICLVHIFPPITYIPSPVGMLSRSQLSQQQVQSYIKVESNRRKNLLEKYICLCNEAKVPVDTILVESNSPAKALLDLIPVVNVRSLVIGTKRSLSTTICVRKVHGVGEYVQKNAPASCKVTIVGEDKKIKNGQVLQLKETGNSSSIMHSRNQQEITKNSERNFFECMCFSGKFD